MGFMPWENHHMRQLDLGPCSPRFLALATILILVGLPAVTGADGWGDDDPAEATSENLEDHMAESEDPSDLEVDSQDIPLENGKAEFKVHDVTVEDIQMSNDFEVLTPTTTLKNRPAET